MISYFVLNQSNHTQRVDCGIHFNPLSKSKIEGSADVNEFTVNNYILL